MSKPLSPFHAAREAIRFRAYQLYTEGWSLTSIAHGMGVTLSAVSQWMKTVREQGEDALRAHPAPGATPRLTAEQLRQLVELLHKGAEAHGFQGDLWTAARVAVLIEHTFGVTYGERHVRRLLHTLKWSRQHPITQEAKRDEAAIAHFRHVRYPALKTMPKRGHDPAISR